LKLKRNLKKKERVEGHLLDRQKVLMTADQNLMIVLHTEAGVQTINHPADLTDQHGNSKENPNLVKEPSGPDHLKAGKEPDQEDQIPIVFQTADYLHPRLMAQESYA
jgi:hypothetical protein